MAIYSDWFVILSTVCYVLSCRIYNARVIDAVSSSVGSGLFGQAIQKHKMRIIVNLLFIFFCLGFASWRLHELLAIYQIDPPSTWIIPILFLLYGGYVSLFNVIYVIVFNKIKNNLQYRMQSTE